MIWSQSLLWILACYAFHSAQAATFTNGTYFWGVSIQPQAPIFKFDSTIIVPRTPDQPVWNAKDNNVGAMWPGIQNVPELMQHVIANDDPQWIMVPYFCCQPAEYQVPPRHVYPGDEITVQYRWHDLSQTWYDNWIINPGEAGHAAGEVTLASGLILGPFDQLYSPSSSTTNHPHAMLYVETQEGEQWDWGTVYWKDILIEAQTQETDWCTGNWAVEQGWDSLIWNRTTPVATVNAAANTTSCFIASIVYEGHG